MKALPRYRNRNGYVLWVGPSKIDGAPIVAIATGFSRRTGNRKTGPMIQTWIERADVPANVARKDGSDRSICGNCPLHDSCYVDVSKAPRAVSRSYLLGNYDPFPGIDSARIARPDPWRIGSYGDPFAVPVSIWRAIVSGLKTWTGYTHQWKRAPYLADFLMASVESPEGKREARARGFRTFRVIRPSESLAKDEILCPASPEAGARTSCAHCGLCKGTATQARSIAIVAHGAALPNRWRK